MGLLEVLAVHVPPIRRVADDHVVDPHMVWFLKNLICVAVNDSMLQRHPLEALRFALPLGFLLQFPEELLRFLLRLRGGDEWVVEVLGEVQGSRHLRLLRGRRLFRLEDFPSGVFDSLTACSSLALSTFTLLFHSEFVECSHGGDSLLPRDVLTAKVLMQFGLEKVGLGELVRSSEGDCSLGEEVADGERRSAEALLELLPQVLVIANEAEGAQPSLSREESLPVLSEADGVEKSEAPQALREVHELGFVELLADSIFWNDDVVNEDSVHDNDVVVG